MRDIIFEGVRTSENLTFTFSIPTGKKVIIETDTRKKKKTLLHLLTGQQKSFEGKFIFGKLELKRKTDWLEYKKALNFINPRGSLISNMNLYENIMLPSIYHKFNGNPIPVDELNKIVFKLSEKLKLPDMFENKPDDVTPVHRIKVALARGLVVPGKVFIMDNVLEEIARGEWETLSAIITELLSENTLIIFDKAKYFKEKIKANILTF